MTTLTSQAMIDADAALVAAINTYREANARCAYYGLRLLALHAREVWPEATTLVLDWSDQGDYLTVTEVLGADGDSAYLGAALNNDPDPEGWAGNLAGNNEDTWAPLADAEQSEFCFTIDKVIAATAEPFTWTTPEEG